MFVKRIVALSIAFTAAAYGQAFQPPPMKAPPMRAPTFKAPEFKAPEFKAPEFKGPDFKGPDFRSPFDKNLPAVVVPAPAAKKKKPKCPSIMGEDIFSEDRIIESTLGEDSIMNLPTLEEHLREQSIGGDSPSFCFQ